MSLLEEVGVVDAAETCDVAADDGFWLLSGGERDAAFMVTEREIRRLQAVQLVRVRRVAVSGGFADDGFQTVGSWLRAVTNGSRRHASSRVGLARLLGEMPVLAAATARGGVGDDQLRVLHGLFANNRCRPHLAGADELLTGYAVTLSFEDFRRVCQRFEAWADPDGVELDHGRVDERRSVRFSRVGAGFVLHAEGPAYVGEQLAQILAAHEPSSSPMSPNVTPAVMLPRRWRGLAGNVVSMRWSRCSTKPLAAPMPPRWRSR